MSQKRSHPPEALVPVWIAMAEHFLDTENRYAIPTTALVCLDAGLTPKEASVVWSKQVAPTLGWNMLSVAGEWMGWDEAWLCREIVKTRRANWLAKLTIHRGFARLSRGAWLPIEKSMQHLVPLDPADRELHAQALSDLARHFYDFMIRPAELVTSSCVKTMKQLYPQPFMSIIKTNIFEDEGITGPIRVREAIAMLEATR